VTDYCEHDAKLSRSIKAAISISRTLLHEVSFNWLITKYTLMHHKNGGQNQNIRRANKPFEKVAKFKYLESTVTNENNIQNKIKSMLNYGNECYCSKSFIFL